MIAIAEQASISSESEQQDIAVEKAEPREVVNETSTMGTEDALCSISPLSGHEDSGEEDLGANEFKAPPTFYPNGRPRAIPFPLKLMELLSSKEHEDIITWTPSGLAFHILKPKPFTGNVLPEYFKSVKFSSFVRKLNRWGFAKNYITDGEPSGSYQHKFFQKGCLKLVQKMRPAARAPPLKIKGPKLPNAKSPAPKLFAPASTAASQDPSQVLPSGFLFAGVPSWTAARRELATQQGHAASAHANLGTGSPLDVNEQANAVRRLLSQRGTVNYGSDIYPSGVNAGTEFQLNRLLAQQAERANLQARERAVFDLEVKRCLEEQARNAAPTRQALTFSLERRLGQAAGAGGYGGSNYAMEAEVSRLLGSLVVPNRQAGLQPSAYSNPLGMPALSQPSSNVNAAIELEVIRRLRERTDPSTPPSLSLMGMGQQERGSVLPLQIAMFGKQPSNASASTNSVDQNMLALLRGHANIAQVPAPLGL